MESQLRNPERLRKGLSNPLKDLNESFKSLSPNLRLRVHVLNLRKNAHVKALRRPSAQLQASNQSLECLSRGFECSTVEKYILYIYIYLFVYIHFLLYYI